MNIAGKGVLLIIAVIAMGIIVLNEGFDNEPSSTFSEPANSDQQDQSQEEPNQEEQQVAESSASEQTDTEQKAGDAQTDESQTTSTSVLHPEAEVRVLVANGTEVTGAAGATLDTLVANAGYNGVQAVNDIGDEINAKINLSRSLIEMEQIDEARRLLEEVLKENLNSNDQSVANDLLESIK